MAGFVHPATCVAIGARCVLIEGAPGSGKSSLALALIDRGARLVGDDGVTLAQVDGGLHASPPPRIAGLLEVRNLGLVRYPVVEDIPLALVVRLDPEAERFREVADVVEIGGTTLPSVSLWPGEASLLAMKVQLALQLYGRD